MTDNLFNVEFQLVGENHWDNYCLLDHLKEKGQGVTPEGNQVVQNIYGVNTSLE